MLPKTSVTVIRRQEVGKDPFNTSIYENVREDVAGVLVTPGATSDLDASRPEGVRVAYTIHFPKGYGKTLKGCLVQHLGDTYRVIGDPQPYMGDGTPGPWDMAAEVERVDG
ncbi:MAG TPA: hypothetical protein IAA22_01015 [Candidatus Olsenella stercoravium]|uniref:Phage protein n=1 Tax=Candidatus Olsenella stercoravium TaxID=2838713 RepID=A0A9D2INS5_9ACTN|nr:hypothetical protein [Candidatus Olsenella stercoravium]